MQISVFRKEISPRLLRSIFYYSIISDGSNTNWLYMYGMKLCSTGGIGEVEQKMETGKPINLVRYNFWIIRPWNLSLKVNEEKLFKRRALFCYLFSCLKEEHLFSYRENSHGKKIYLVKFRPAALLRPPARWGRRIWRAVFPATTKIVLHASGRIRRSPGTIPAARCTRTFRFASHGTTAYWITSTWHLRRWQSCRDGPTTDDGNFFRWIDAFPTFYSFNISNLNSARKFEIIWSVCVILRAGFHILKLNYCLSGIQLTFDAPFNTLPRFRNDTWRPRRLIGPGSMPTFRRRLHTSPNGCLFSHGLLLDQHAANDVHFPPDDHGWDATWPDRLDTAQYSRLTHAQTSGRCCLPFFRHLACYFCTLFSLLGSWVSSWFNLF